MERPSVTSSAYSISACDDREAYVQSREAAVDEEVRRVPLHRRAQRQDDLTDTATAYPLNELGDLQIVGTNAVNRGDDPAEDMVDTAVLTGILDSHHIAYVLYDADGGAITLGAGADRAELGITDVVALPAVDDTISHLYEGISEGMGIDRGA